nr:phage portal protein [uncultured Sphaerochaeta sp.]
MIPIYTLQFEDRLTESQILRAIAAKEMWNTELKMLEDYYNARNRTILQQDRNHKVAVPFGRKLIKNVLGFMFKEGCITYKYPDGDPRLAEKMKPIFDDNDEQTENIRLAREQALYGSAFECLFVDNPNAEPQFYRVPASQMIPVYLPSIKPRMAACINFYTINDTHRHVDVYYKDRIEKFTRTTGGLGIPTVTTHFFGEVPVLEYRNNEEGLGDIEIVLGLIDAHDEILSNGLDEDGKFSDALLLLKNAVLDDEQLDKIREKRILDDLPEDADASYLTKPNVYDGREKLRAKVEDLIYSMSGIPNLSDRDALAQQSGEALKYLYATFEVMVAGDKQSGFTDGLQKRLRLICNYLNWLEGKSLAVNQLSSDTLPYKADQISVKWKRNLPAESTTTINNAVNASPFISQRTVLEQMQQAGIVDDIAEEEKRLIEDQDKNMKKNLDLAMSGYGS